MPTTGTDSVTYYNKMIPTNSMMIDDCDEKFRGFLNRLVF